MMAWKVKIGMTALFITAALAAQQPAAATPVPGDDACMRHCKEMAAARQKMIDEHKAAMDKRDAAWKEIKAQVDAAKGLKGDKKVAALESAFEKLLAFHESMEHSMAMTAGHEMGMDGCMKHESEQAMGMDCCTKGEMHHGTMAMQHPTGGMEDCPMMKGEKPAPPSR